MNKDEDNGWVSIPKKLPVVLVLAAVATAGAAWAKASISATEHDRRIEKIEKADENRDKLMIEIRLTLERVNLTLGQLKDSIDKKK